MFRQLKKFTVNMVAGANVATAILMLMVGFTDYVNPSTHPLLATLGLAFPAFLLANLGFLFFWLLFCRRMVWIPIMGFIVAYAPVRTYIPFNAPRDTPLGAIKVMSYNVQAFNGVGSSDEDAAGEIFDYLQATRPDIVCLQEGFDSWRHVKERLDTLFAHNDSVLLGTNGYRNSLCIFTKYPILRKERIPYASKYDANASMAYYLDINGRTVLVINNHFESNRLTESDKQKYKDILKGTVQGDTAKKDSKLIIFKLTEAAHRRCSQADAVHAYIEKHKGRYPVIVCGDFNDNPISYTHRVVAKGLTDCYVSTANGLGLSYNQKGFYVRIDNMLCSDKLEPYNCHVDNTIKASDHYPIVCWMKFSHRP